GGRPGGRTPTCGQAAGKQTGTLTMPIELTQTLRRIAQLFGFAGTIFAAGIALAAEDAAPKVSFQTSLGEIIFELDREHAPATVANVLTYVNEGHFDGTELYRVVPGVGI